MKDLMIEVKIEQLEFKLKKQQDLIIKLSKYATWKIVGKYLIPRIAREEQILSETFRELREVTRKVYPEKFINSGGNTL
tara:strand:- start:350 stop:586 length:237 start_codon:yes stop_codon:yes gene_type:complete